MFDCYIVWPSHASLASSVAFTMAFISFCSLCCFVLSIYVSEVVGRVHWAYSTVASDFAVGCGGSPWLWMEICTKTKKIIKQSKCSSRKTRSGVLVNLSCSDQLWGCHQCGCSFLSWYHLISFFKRHLSFGKLWGMIIVYICRSCDRLFIAFIIPLYITEYCILCLYIYTDLLE